MSNKILVTDSLFIFDEHVKQLEAAGYEVERLDKPKATDDELKAALQGKVGYILGGIESVTSEIIEAANELKVISCTVSDWRGFVPGWELATKKGIAISNAPDAFTNAVAEMTLTLLLTMLRDIPSLSRIGSVDFRTVPGIGDVQIGIVGLGHIGSKVANLLQGIGARNIIYWDRNRKESLESNFGIRYVGIDDLMRNSDVITNHLSNAAGQVIGRDLIELTKPEVIFINAGAESTFDYDAVADKIRSSGARIAVDLHGPPDALKDLPVNKAFYTNVNTGFNTTQAIRSASDVATLSMTNLLQTGQAQYKVN